MDFFSFTIFIYYCSSITPSSNFRFQFSHWDSNTIKTAEKIARIVIFFFENYKNQFFMLLE
jgi:hypothetical protein